MISLFKIQKHKRGFTFWYNREFKGGQWIHTKSVSFGNYYGIWEKRGIIKFRTNRAEKNNPLDTCFDCTLTIGKFDFGYTNWNY